MTVKNKLGATNHEELERLEVEHVVPRLIEIELGLGPTGTFDAQHLKAIHRHLFRDVYEWSGHTRNERVALSDGAIATEPVLPKADGPPFLPGPAIPAALDAIAQILLDSKFLRGLPREEFIGHAAVIVTKLNAAHPFREGNGRTQRAFMRQLATEAGHSLDFSVISKERMIQASSAAYDQDDLSMMHRMFEEISDPRRVALLREGIEKLQGAADREAEHTGRPERFNWNDHYVATLAPGHAVEPVLAGIAGDQFLARSKNQILFGETSDLPQPLPKIGQIFTIISARFR
jgi:cell filamentation protein